MVTEVVVIEIAAAEAEIVAIAVDEIAAVTEAATEVVVTEEIEAETVEIAAPVIVETDLHEPKVRKRSASHRLSR